MDENSIKLITGKLDAIIKLMVMGLTIDKSQSEQIRLLSIAGFAPKDIAEILGTSPNTVRVMLSILRKQKKKRS